MSNTFTPLTGQGDNDEYELDNPFGYQSAERARQCLNVLGYIAGHLDLGGSDDAPLEEGSPAGWEPVRGYRDYELDGDELGGLTLQVVVYSRLGSDGSPFPSPMPTMQWRLRNVTDGTNAALGTAHSELTIQKETATVSLTSGAKLYRLEVTHEEGAEGFIYCYGYLRFRKVPA